MERVPDIVANVFTQSGIQIGTLTVEDHQKIMKAALRNKDNYIEQAKNAGIVFFKTFFVFFKTFLFMLAALISLILMFDNGASEAIESFFFNKNATLSSMGFVSQEESIMILYSTLFFIMYIFKFSFYGAIMISAMTISISVFYSMYMSSKKIMHDYTNKETRERLLNKSKGQFRFSFWCGFRASDFGARCFFQEEIDTEIKKALQEQSDCKIVVKYQESN